jgi:hypothetical protein
MPTYISVVHWSGWPQPRVTDVRASIDAQGPTLRRRGLHSVAFVPEEGDCAAVMVSTCSDEPAVARLADAILPGAQPSVESMRFDDDASTAPPAAREAVPPPLRDYRRALLRALVAEA